MLIAVHSPSEYVSHHISDHPWPGCEFHIGAMKVSWMSDSIATMLLTAIVLAAVLPLLARRRQTVPRGGYNALEVLVAFIRDRIARPALHARADVYMPFLLTLFFFILGMNLIGLVPTQSVSVLVNDWLGIHGQQYTLGASPTGVLFVCAGLASLTLLNVVGRGLLRAARHTHEHRHWPLALCLLLSPVLWILSLSPPMEGAAGVVLLVPLAILEFAGTLAKCFALMIRLFANLMAGHGLIAVMMLFVAQASESILAAWYQALGIGAVCILAGVLLGLLEMLVAALQAYIFTYLSAIFLSLYAEGHHGG